MAHKELPVVSMVYAKEVSVACPNCHYEIDGFTGKANGHDVECDQCGMHFKVADEVDIEYHPFTV